MNYTTPAFLVSCAFALALSACPALAAPAAADNSDASVETGTVFRVNFGELADPLGQALQAMDEDALRKYVRIRVGDTELREVQPRSVSLNSNSLDIRVDPSDVAGASDVTVSLGDRPCAAARYYSADRTWNGTLYEVPFAECTGYSRRDQGLKPKKDPAESACFPISSSGSKSQGAAISGLLRELGEDPNILAGDCPSSASCLGFTTLVCAPGHLYSADEPNPDDFDLKLETAGCPAGQHKYVLTRKKTADGKPVPGNNLSYDMLCTCVSKF